MKRKTTDEEKAKRRAKKNARRGKIEPRAYNRKLGRSIARFNMKRAGITRMKYGFFAANWRKYFSPKRTMA